MCFSKVVNANWNLFVNKFFNEFFMEEKDVCFEFIYFEIKFNYSNSP